MTTPSLEDIATNLAELLTNSVNIVDKYFDIFFNPNPMYVTLEQYNSEGVIETYSIPNRAMDRSIAMTGTVDPEGIVEAGLGQLYINTVTRNVFLKATSSGKTGWINFTPDRTSFINDTFSVTTATTSVTLTQEVNSKNELMVFFNDEYIKTSDYSLSNNQTITFLNPFTTAGTVEARYFINLTLADSSVLTQAQAYKDQTKAYRDEVLAQQISSITIGTVTTGAAGSQATVTNSGTAKNQVWDMSIPKGDTGSAGTIAVGTVTTGSSGTPASVVNSGTQTAAVFDFTLPKGDTVVTASVGTTTTLPAGSNATVTNSGTSTELVLDFGIPRGSSGSGVPAGGTTGQLLQKQSSTDYDVTWSSFVIPTKISDLTDDTATYPVDKADTLTGLITTTTELNTLSGISTNTTVQSQLNTKQNTLVSGTNIKTINNNSILGSGNLTVSGLPSQTGYTSAALMTDGTDATWNETADCRVVTSASSTTILPSWWRVYSDGWVEQGGHLGQGSDSEITVTFIKTMRDTNYAVLKTNSWYYNGYATFDYTNVWSKTTTGFNTKNSQQTTNGSGFDWYVCGYGAGS